MYCSKKIHTSETLTEKKFMRLGFPPPLIRFLNSPSLTNKNIALIYPFTISEEETKDCVLSGNFQHSFF